MNIFIMEDKTSIAISRKIRNQLASLGTKDSTFDEIIQDLIKKIQELNDDKSS